MKYPTKPPHEVTELAKERNRQASERTVASWINHSLLLVGFGIVAAEIPGGVSQFSAQNRFATYWQLSFVLSLGMIIWGIVVLIPIAIAHYRALQSLKQANYLTQPASFFNLLIGAVMLFGLTAIVYMILVTSR